MNFNPHSRKGSDVKYSSKRYDMDDFNPHSRKGSDIFEPVNLSAEFISIHTPARGVTGKYSIGLRFKEISIHTPARGVT